MKRDRPAPLDAVAQRTVATMPSTQTTGSVATFGLLAPEHPPPLSAVIQRATADPRSLTRADVMALQRTIGNAAVAQLLRKAAPGANKTGLPDGLKSGMENLSGLALDDVRVHYNSSKPAQVQALAYAQGTDIHVAPGQEKHLPHEAWHVVQQKQGRVKPTLQMKGVAINDDDALEREADAMGAQAGYAVQLKACQCSPGCGCAACATKSSAPGGSLHPAAQAKLAPSPNQIGRPAVIQRWECPVCGNSGLKAKDKSCTVCGTARPKAKAASADTKSAGAAPVKTGGAARAKVSKASADAKESKESPKGQPTHSIRVQLQLVTPKKVELSVVVHHFDGKPITQAEGIEALNALLEKALVEGVVKSILEQAYGEVGPKVAEKIKGGSIGQSESTYFETAKEKNRIDVENMRGALNFSA